MIRVTTPTRNRSSSPGSSTDRSFWATRKISCFCSIAAFSAATDFLRPTSNWSIISGKITNPRNARTGISPPGMAVRVFSLTLIAVVSFLSAAETAKKGRCKAGLPCLQQPSCQDAEFLRPFFDCGPESLIFTGLRSGLYSILGGFPSRTVSPVISTFSMV